MNNKMLIFYNIVVVVLVLALCILTSIKTDSTIENKIGKRYYTIEEISYLWGIDEKRLYDSIFDWNNHLDDMGYSTCREVVDKDFGLTNKIYLLNKEQITELISVTNTICPDPSMHVHVEEK